MNETTAGLIDLISIGQSLIQDKKIPLLPTQWLLVDEYHDTDLEQVKFILIHALSGVKILLVGDPDQSIYGFRNALGSQAFKISRENISIKDFSLNMNYRSKPEILIAAQNLINHNPHNKEAMIEANQSKGGTTECMEVKTPYEEALLVVKLIELRKSNNVAIIARSNFRLNLIEKTLKEHGIEYSRKNNSSQFNVAELLFLSLISSLAKRNKDNLTSFLEPMIKNHNSVALISKKCFGQTT